MISLIHAAASVVSIYFMLGSEDANRRFNVSFRNQIKYLVGFFAYFALHHVITIISGASFSGNIVNYIFAIMNAFVAYSYYKKL